MKNAKTIVIVATVTIIIMMVLFALYTKNVSTKAIDNANVQAFLKMLRYSEGTSGPDGYRTMFTGVLFNNNYSDHPRQTHCAGTLCSTAAGAYQFLSTTWDYLRIRLQLSDFSPANQDLAAVELIREKGALDDVINGNFAAAVEKCNRTWASLPGSPYGQPTHSLAQLQSVYQNNGGNYA